MGLVHVQRRHPFARTRDSRDSRAISSIPHLAARYWLFRLCVRRASCPTGSPSRLERTRCHVLGQRPLTVCHITSENAVTHSLVFLATSTTDVLQMLNFWHAADRPERWTHSETPPDRRCCRCRRER